MNSFNGAQYGTQEIELDKLQIKLTGFTNNLMWE